MPSRLSRRAASLVLVLGAALTSTNCGFILTNAPPSNHQGLSYFSCTESNGGPIIDLVWAGLNLLGAATADPSTTENPDQVVTVGVAWTLVSGSAALVGFDKTRKCREAKRMLAERQSQRAVLAGDPAATANSPQAVTINPSVDTVRVGGSVQLQADSRASSGAPITGLVFTWSSSNDAIASVNGAGLATAHAPGSVVIAVRTGTAVAIARLVVLPP